MIIITLFIIICFILFVFSIAKDEVKDFPTKMRELEDLKLKFTKSIVDANLKRIIYMYNTLLDNKSEFLDDDTRNLVIEILDKSILYVLDLNKKDVFEYYYLTVLQMHTESILDSLYIIINKDNSRFKERDRDVYNAVLKAIPFHLVGEKLPELTEYINIMKDKFYSKISLNKSIANVKRKTFNRLKP